MPRIQWERLPREKWAHLRDRARERMVSQDDLFELAEWKAQDPDVPDGDWYKDFGTFKLCGTGKFPSTFLMAGQSARGKRLRPPPRVSPWGRRDRRSTVLRNNHQEDRPGEVLGASFGRDLCVPPLQRQR